MKKSHCSLNESMNFNPVGRLAKHGVRNITCQSLQWITGCTSWNSNLIPICAACLRSATAGGLLLRFCNGTDLFNEAEVNADTDTAEIEEEIVIPSHKRKKRTGKKEEDLSNFEVTKTIEYKLTGKRATADQGKHCYSFAGYRNHECKVCQWHAAGKTETGIRKVWLSVCWLSRYLRFPTLTSAPAIPELEHMQKSTKYSPLNLKQIRHEYR